jgi:hypothetical protein
MLLENQIKTCNRRDFLSKVTAPALFFSFGCKNIFDGELYAKDLFKQTQHKFQKNSNMSIEQVMNFAFNSYYLPIMRGLREKLGSKKLIEMIKEVTDGNYYRSGMNLAKRTEKNNVYGFIENFWKPTIKSNFWGNAVTIEIIKQESRSGIVKNTECLLAKIFRDAKEIDIGYATCCYGDFGQMRGFNPNIKLTRNKSIMQGDDCCYFEYFLEV